MPRKASTRRDTASKDEAFRPTLSQRIRSTVSEVIDDTAHAGEEVEWAGQQLSKAARVARQLDDDFENAYPATGSRPSSRPSSQQDRISASRQSERPMSRSSMRKESAPEQSTTESESEGQGLLERSLIAPKSATTAIPNDDAEKRRASETPLRPPSSKPLSHEKDNAKKAPARMESVMFRKSLFLNKIDSFEDVEDYKAVIEETDQLIKSTSFEVTEIKFRRQQLVGMPYSRAVPIHKVNFKSAEEAMEWKMQPNRQDQTRADEVHDATWLASLVTTTQGQLKAAYKGVRLLKRQSPAKEGNNTMGLSASEIQTFKLQVAKLQHDFNQVMDKIENLGEEEKGEAASGAQDERLINRLRDRNPSWSRSKVLKAVKDAKVEKRNAKGIASLDLESPAGTLILQNPFTEISKTVDYIRKYSTGISSSDPWPAAVGNGMTPRPSSIQPGFFGRWFGHGAAVQDRKVKKSKKSGRSSKHTKNAGATYIDPQLFNIGHKKDKRLLSSGKDLPHMETDVSTDDTDLFPEQKAPKKRTSQRSSYIPPTAADVLKDRVGTLTSSPLASRSTEKIVRPPILSSDDDFPEKPQRPVPLGPDGLPLKLGYRVPTDDPNDSETYSELIEDEREKVRNEHIFIPLTIFFWICVFALLIYWGVAKLSGFENPLGDVDLGSHLGNDAWNDTMVSEATSTTTKIDSALSSASQTTAMSTATAVATRR